MAETRVVVQVRACARWRRPVVTELLPGRIDLGPGDHHAAEMRYWILGFLVLSARALAAVSGHEQRSHSHNDYLQERPLATALAARMGSVEVDIWLVDGALLVAHERTEIVPGRTLRSLYLEPLREHVRREEGRVYAGKDALILLVDIKSEAEPTYAALARELEAYQDLFSRYESGVVTPGAVTVLVSGNVPKALMARQTNRLAAADGRPSDLEGSYPVETVPLISENWNKLFRWDGKGAMPLDQRDALRAWVRRSHDQGRRVRLWAAPDTPAAWKEQADAGVDFINTDRPEDLGAFLATYVALSLEK